MAWTFTDRLVYSNTMAFVIYVAMGNAFSEVKEAADYITSTNEEDGVAHVIEKFIGIG